MPRFNIPIVLQIKANSEHEAEGVVMRLINAANTYAEDHEPKTRKAFKSWDFAEIQIRAKGDK